MRWWPDLMSLSQSLVCDKCKSLLDRVRQLMEELEAVRRSLLENLEQKLSVNCRVTDVGGRNWQDCIDGLLTNMKEQNWRKNVTNFVGSNNRFKDYEQTILDSRLRLLRI